MAGWRQRSGNRVERGSRWPRTRPHPVVLDDCMSLQDALGKAGKRMPVEAGAQQSCPAVQGEEAAGRVKHCWEGWEICAKPQPNCPVASKLLEAEHCWHHAEELLLPLLAELNSAEFSH